MQLENQIQRAVVARFYKRALSGADLDSALEDFLQGLIPLKETPWHAGAIFDSLEKLTDILNLIEETGAAKQDDRLDRSVDVTRNYWNGVGDKLRHPKDGFNDFLKETGKGILFDVDRIKRMVNRTKEILGSGQIESILVGNMKVRNMTGQSITITEDVIGVLHKVLGTLESKSLAQVARGEVLIIRQDQFHSAERYSAGAAYSSKDDRVRLAYPCTDRDPVERILHEFGHRFWFKFLDEGQQLAWVASWKNLKSESGPFVTPYAETGGPREDFAECFAYYTLGKLREPNLSRLKSFI